MLAKPIGLLLVSYGLWILATFGLIENTTGGILVVLIGVAALSVWAWRGFPARSAQDDRASLRGLWREHRALFMAYEIVLAAALIGWALFRAITPIVDHREANGVRLPQRDQSQRGVSAAGSMAVRLRHLVLLFRLRDDVHYAQVDGCDARHHV
jgi:hypothetical protein